MGERRYFWLKLKEDFFESKRIKKLRRLAGGDTLTIIYLKMQLKSIKTEGVLTYTGLEHSFAEELALDLDEEPDNVALLLNYLASVGLIETSDDVNFLLPFVVENTGSEGSSAERMRNLRSRQKASLCDAGVTQPLLVSDVEKEIDKEKEKDRDKKHKYGEYQHVLLSDSDYSKLKEQFPDYEKRIKNLDEYLENNPKKHYANHYLTIKTWARKDALESKEEESKEDYFVKAVQRMKK